MPLLIAFNCSLISYRGLRVKLTIKARLWLFGTILLALMAVIMAFGVSGMSSLERAISTIYDDRLIPTRQLGRINGLMRDNQMQLGEIATYNPQLEENRGIDGATQINQHAQVIIEQIAEIDRIWQAYMATSLTAEEAASAEKFLNARMTFVSQGLRPALSHYQRGDFTSGNRHVRESVRPLFYAASETLRQLLEFQESIADSIYSDVKSEQRKSLAIKLLSFSVALIFGLLFTLLLVRSIDRPLKRMIDYFSAMAQGDLTQDIQVGRKDEIGQTLQSLQAMQSQLHETIYRIQQSADNIATGSAQISTGNLDLSQRTEEQASSLQETATSMEQVAATVRQNAEHIAEANKLASEASQAAKSGGEQSHEVKGKMGELNESSEKIRGIVDVIDSIAFQTNILALNASVEAARAGEQGRGFAVVASEVRNLAQRSADAAKEIQTLIGVNSSIVQDGTQLVEAAVHSMEAIVTSVDRVSTLMHEVAQGSQEQSSAVEQVNTAVNEMDHVTQQNAALVEQTANASASLQDQASDLSRAVSVFKLARQEYSPHTTPSIASSRTQALSTSKQARTPTFSKESHNKLHTNVSQNTEGEWETF
jgi:methyl-accepting chemotaxis protein-1 (serine sensor receptor)|tara:strand:+ start:857 stop:2641 length:1785 start_codon:yes stop_codon:yes gene_type:complete